MKMSEWLPIETAPKDGTAILLLARAYTHPGVMGDMPEIHHPARAYIGCWNAEGDSWTDEYGNLNPENGEICTLTVTGTWSSGDGWFQPNEVSHWMPLPEPPSSASALPENK